MSADADAPQKDGYSPAKAGLFLLGVFVVGGALTNGWAWLKNQPWAPGWMRRNRKGGG